MVKKIFLIGILMASTMLVSAQCVEVKGVETEMVCYENCNPNDEDNWSGWTQAGTTKYPKIGFKFSNMNKYQVTIEAELWNTNAEELYSSIELKESINKTKTFVLEAGEDYVWKVSLSAEGELRYRYKNNYVKFKTFKCP
jgi:hypothetical protein